MSPGTRDVAPPRLAGNGDWKRLFTDLREFAASGTPLAQTGRLTRVAGLVMEASGLRLPVGAVCAISPEGGVPVDAEVVGFAHEGADLLVATDRGRLQSVALATGATNWDVDLGGEPLGAPIIKGSHVWQTLRTGLVKLDRSTGAKATVTPATEGEHGGAAVLFGDRLVVPTAAGPTVYSADSGEARYRLEGSKKARVLASPEEVWVVESGQAIAVYRNLQ